MKRHLKSLHGMVLLDKEWGISSHRALQQVRFLYQAKKAGHTGILDPLASGLLPICFGEANKFSQCLLEADKAYECDIQFGKSSTTGDLEGCLTEGDPCSFTESELLTLIQKWNAYTYWQTPPMYSALKHKGRPLYEYARQGLDVDRPARSVRLHKITLLFFDAKTYQVQIYVRCSKGTYIRALVEDLAKALGTCAYVARLRRVETGPFGIGEAYTLADMQETELPELLPVDSALQHLPLIFLTEGRARQSFLSGQKIKINDFLEDDQLHRVYDDCGDFLGVALTNAYQQCIQPARVISPELVR